MLDIAILKQKLSALTVETDPNAITQSADTVSGGASTASTGDGLSEGYVRKTIMTPHGEMNVLVPSSSDKAKDNVPDGVGVTSLQALINNAVSIDINGRGEITSYVDPNESKFAPGTGQIKRQPAKLTAGQRRRLEGGDGIITDPIIAAPIIAAPISAAQSPATIADFESARTAAVVKKIESGQSTIKPIKRVETQASDAVAAVSELGKGSCCYDGLLKQPAKTIERDVASIAHVVSRGDKYCDILEGEEICTNVTQDDLDFEELKHVMTVFGFNAKDVVNMIKDEVNRRPGDFWDKTLNYLRK